MVSLVQPAGHSIKTWRISKRKTNITAERIKNVKIYLIMPIKVFGYD